MKPEALSIDSQVFDDLRMQISQALNRCVARMRETGMMEGSVSAKIGLEFIDSRDKEPGTGPRVDVMKIDGKIGMTVPMRYEGKVNSKIGIQCVRGENSFMIADGQISMEEILDGYDDEL